MRNSLLELTGRSVDKQANRRVQSAPGATLNQGHLNASQGVTSLLNVTVLGGHVVSFREAIAHHNPSKVVYYCFTTGSSAKNVLQSHYGQVHVKGFTFHGTPKTTGCDFGSAPLNRQENEYHN